VPTDRVGTPRGAHTFEPATRGPRPSRETVAAPRHSATRLAAEVSHSPSARLLSTNFDSWRSQSDPTSDAASASVVGSWSGVDRRIDSRQTPGREGGTPRELECDRSPTRLGAMLRHAKGGAAPRGFVGTKEARNAAGRRGLAKRWSRIAPLRRRARSTPAVANLVGWRTPAEGAREAASACVVGMWSRRSALMSEPIRARWGLYPRVNSTRAGVTRPARAVPHTKPLLDTRLRQA
jgi:hypothetical protein